MARSGLLRVLAATVALMAGTGMAAAPAWATWPGQNGRILFSAVEDMTPEPPLARAADCGNSYFTFLSSAGVDGSDPRLLAPGGVLPALSPAGALAYFDLGTDCNGYMSPPDYPLRLREPGTGDERTVVTRHDPRSVDPDTTRLAWDRAGGITYSRRGRIMSVDPQSGSSRLVAKGSSATWSSGDELALTRRRARGPRSRLFVISGGRTRTVTTADATSPDWSPNGRWIAFARRSFHRGEIRRSAVYVIGRDGRGLRRVTADSVRLALTPVWSPDGRWIAFIRVRASGSTLMVVPSDGTGGARAVVRRVVEPAQLAWEALPEAGDASGRTARADTAAASELRGVVATLDGTSVAVWSRFVGDHGATVFSSWREPGRPEARSYAQPWGFVAESAWALTLDATLTEAWTRSGGALRVRRLGLGGQIGSTIEPSPRSEPVRLLAAAAPDGSTTLAWIDSEVITIGDDLPTSRDRIVGQRIDAQGHALARFELMGPRDESLTLESLATSSPGTAAALVRLESFEEPDFAESLALAREGGAPAIVAPAASGPAAMDLAPDGGAYVAWGAEAGVFARSVSPAGVPGPVVSVSPLMDRVDVLAYSGDSALVAWSRTWKTQKRVVVRAIGPGGAPGPAVQLGWGELGAPGPAVQLGWGELGALERAGDGAVIVWIDEELERTGTRMFLHLRRVATDGTPGTDVIVRQAGEIASPVAAAAADGSLLMAWTRFGWKDDVIEARRIGSDGSLGPVTQIAWPLQVRVDRLPRGCVPRRVKAHVETTVAPTDRLTGIRATIDGRAVARGRRATLRVAIRARTLAPGRHRLVVVATTAQGERRSVRRSFRVCR